MGAQIQAVWEMKEEQSGRGSGRQFGYVLAEEASQAGSAYPLRWGGLGGGWFQAVRCGCYG